MKSVFLVCLLAIAFIAGCTATVEVHYPAPIVSTTRVIESDINTALEHLKANNAFVSLQITKGAVKDEYSLYIANGSTSQSYRFNSLEEFNKWYEDWKL